ncbi:MAG: PH domain-containing protein [Woeseia sp.]
MFENSEIALDELPGAESLAWRPLDSRYVPRLQIDALITTAVIAVIVLAVQYAPLPIDIRWRSWVPWLLLPAFGLSLVLWPLLSVPRKAYALRDKDLFYRSGVLWQSVTAVPFNRVQHVETSSTPLDRLFGHAALQVFTAGGSGGDLKISGLPADVAEKLRLFILEKAGADLEHG